MIEEKLDLTWYCMGRVDLQPDLLPLMRKAGLWAMSFGLETGNADTLERMRKQLRPEQAKTTIKALQKLGARTIGSFILGYPGETERHALNTVEYAVKLDLDVAVFFIPVPFPATKLLEDCKADGGIKPDLQWQDYSAWLDHNNPIYTNPTIGRERHIEIYNYAFRRFYGRPRYIWKQVAGIRSVQDVRRLLQGFKSIEGLMRRGLLKKGLALIEN
jgi:anaerobic magnesium-protoporphyrin IX monomethyl ester cyclase